MSEQTEQTEPAEPEGPDATASRFAAFEAQRAGGRGGPTDYFRLPEMLESLPAQHTANPDGGADPKDAAKAGPATSPKADSGGASEQTSGDAEKTPSKATAKKGDGDKPDAKAAKAEARAGRALRQQQKEIADLKKQIESLKQQQQAPATKTTSAQDGAAETTDPGGATDAERYYPEVDDYPTLEEWETAYDAWVAGDIVEKPATAGSTTDATAATSKPNEPDPTGEEQRHTIPSEITDASRTRQQLLDELEERVEAAEGLPDDLWETLEDLGEKGRFFLSDEMGQWLLDGDDDRLAVLVEFSERPIQSRTIATKTAANRHTRAMERLLAKVQNRGSEATRQTGNLPAPDALRGHNPSPDQKVKGFASYERQRKETGGGDRAGLAF